MPTKRPQERGLPAFTTNLKSSPSSLAFAISTVHPTWIAGESVEGTLELSVLKDNVWLGEIALEFTAFEELKSQDHTSSRRLFSTEIKFQGPSLPPSNAILPSYATSLPGGPGDFLPARKGRTRFPFTFELPLTTGSSASIYNNARRFYELRAIGTSRFEGDVSFVSKKLVVDVVEDWEDWDAAEFQSDVERTKSELVRKGGAERIELKARMTGGRLFWRRDVEDGKEGNPIMEVLVTVANRTTKGISGLKLSLHRRLIIIPPPSTARPTVAPPIITSQIHAVSFQGHAYDFHSNAKAQEIKIALEVPTKEECWSTRRGVLFDLEVFLRVAVISGPGVTKDLYVNLPIFIAHPLSLPIAAEQSRRSVIPRSPLYNPEPATYSHHPHPAQQPYHTNGYTPSILPSPSLPILASFSSTPISPANYFNPQHFPPPSSSPAFYNYSPGLNGGAGYVAFDPQQADLTPSRFFGQALPSTMTTTQPYASNSLMVDQQRGVPSRRHSSGENYRAQEQIYQNHPLPPPSPQLSPSGSSTNDRPLSAKGYREVDQPAQQQQPPTTNHLSLLPPTQGSSAPTMIRSLSAGSLSRSGGSQLARTPPPPAPSARFHSPSPSFSLLPASSSIDELQLHDEGLLETIGEDSESAAGGTAKNLSFDVDFLNALRDAAVIEEGKEESVEEIMSVQGVRRKGRDSAGNDSVKTLEEFVEAAEQQQEQKRRLSLDKTLPIVPSPTPPPIVQSIPKVKDEMESKRTREEELRSSKGLSALEARLARTKSPELPSTSIPISTPKIEQVVSPPLVPLKEPPVIPTPPAVDPLPPVVPTIKPTASLIPISRPDTLSPSATPLVAPVKPKKSFDSPWTSRNAIAKPSLRVEEKKVHAGVSPLLLPVTVESKDAGKDSKATRRATVDFTKLPSTTKVPAQVDRNHSPSPIIAPTPKPSLAPFKAHPSAPVPNRRFSLDQYRSPSYPAPSPPPPSTSADKLGVKRSDEEEEERAYDIRSARGGKGGKVSEVKNSWEIFGSSAPVIRATTTAPIGRIVVQSKKVKEELAVGGGGGKREVLRPSMPPRITSASAVATPFINTASGKIAQLSRNDSSKESQEMNKAGKEGKGKEKSEEGGKGKVKELLMRFQSG